MTEQIQQLTAQFPVIVFIGVAVWQVVKYIDTKHLEMNNRYDKLDKEAKEEMKESNLKLIELTTKAVLAIDNNTQVFKDVVANQNNFESNQNLLLANQKAVIETQSKIDSKLDTIIAKII